jgi:nucleobase:cation symporter-1, NCS1 family
VHLQQRSTSRKKDQTLGRGESWRLLSDYGTFIFKWLGGYAAFLGPVAGIMICDYFVIRRRELVLEDLYLRDGVYEYSRGINWRAVIALALGAGTALAGLAIPSLRALYDYSWFVGFAVSFVAYYAMMRGQPRPIAIQPSLTQS